MTFLEKKNVAKKVEQKTVTSGTFYTTFFEQKNTLFKNAIYALLCPFRFKKLYVAKMRYQIPS